MADRTCSIDGCPRPSWARGWCNTHYQQKRERGAFEARGFYTPDASCSVDGCDRRPQALGMCTMHRRRVTKYGSVTALRPNAPTWEQRLWANISPCPNTGCWFWTGAIAHKRGGYGLISIDRTPRRAHIVTYELLVGPVPVGLVLDHLCRVTCCVNPGHLEPVPQRVNTLRGMAPGAVAWRTNICKSGKHRLTTENSYVSPTNGRRQCRACMAAYRAARSAARPKRT